MNTSFACKKRDLDRIIVTLNGRVAKGVREIVEPPISGQRNPSEAQHGSEPATLRCRAEGAAQCQGLFDRLRTDKMRDSKHVCSPEPSLSCFFLLVPRASGSAPSKGPCPGCRISNVPLIGILAYGPLSVPFGICVPFLAVNSLVSLFLDTRRKYVPQRNHLP